MIQPVSERFLRYVTIDTTSDPNSDTCPSSPEKQLPFADLLVKEMKELGIADAYRDEDGYVYGTVPGNIPDYQGPVLGLIAHMDTVCDAPGADIRPRLIENYDGGDILLNEAENIWLRPTDYESLSLYKGKRLIVTDGTTLLGGDDKAGVAEIMTMAETLIQHPEIPHGPIRIGFTPDEEIGRGADRFNVADFGADFGYTLDGGPIGEVEYENFNAASATVKVTGLSIHPGSAKNKMRNALHLAIEFESMLPPTQRPEHTEGYEGFIHLTHFNGHVEEAKLSYIIRDHDKNLFEEKKVYLQRVAAYMNEKYGAGTIDLQITDSYYNMKEQVEPYPFLIDEILAIYEELAIAPHIQPIRGGTDGARLSFMGLPCPNLGTGDHNAHGRFEYVCVDSMEQSVEVLLRLSERFAKLSVSR